MEEKNRLNAKQCSDQELKKIKGGAGTKPQGKPGSLKTVTRNAGASPR